MSYKEAGKIMQDTNSKTRDNVYTTAINNSDLCFGNHDNVDPCDSKFNRSGIPHPECLKKIFLSTSPKIAIIIPRFVPTISP